MFAPKYLVLHYIKNVTEFKKIKIQSNVNLYKVALKCDSPNNSIQTLMYENKINVQKSEHNSFKILNRNNVILSFITSSVIFCKEIIII